MNLLQIATGIFFMFDLMIFIWFYHQTMYHIRKNVLYQLIVADHEPIMVWLILLTMRIASLATLTHAWLIFFLNLFFTSIEFLYVFMQVMKLQKTNIDE